MSGTPIEDLGFLSDCRTTALVDRDGSVEWLCLPDVDSPSVFGRLLDDAAEHCTLAPTTAYDSDRRYRDGTPILDTTFRTASGTVVLTDALTFGAGAGGHELGQRSEGLRVRRSVVTDGVAELRVDVAPRPEYGRIHPIVVPDEHGSLIGNFPQAFSHVGLVNAAWAIHRSEHPENGAE